MLKVNIPGSIPARSPRPSDILRQGEICRPVAGAVIIHEYPADAARTIAKRDEEILIRPIFQPRVELCAMRIKMHLLGGVEMRGVFVIF